MLEGQVAALSSGYLASETALALLEALKASRLYRQDQNSYMMFHKDGDPAATWVPIAAGFGPIPAGQQPCPIPESIRDLWQWPAGKCYPPPQS